MATFGSSKAITKRKNASGNRADVGWQYGVKVDKNSKRVQCKFCEKIFTGGIFRFKHHLGCTRKDVEPCISVPDDVKKKILTILVKNADLAEKKRKHIHDIGDFEDNENEAQHVLVKQKGKGLMDSFVRKGNSMTGSTQTTINQLLKKEQREEVCQQISRFFYACAIPFNCVKHPEFAKMIELIGKYGCGLKPPSYHEIREKYLKKEVARTTDLLNEYKEEWKKTGCTIMSDGWTDKKRRSICNFLVNSPKGTVFLTSIDTSEISKTADKVFQMLDEIVEKVGEDNVVQVVTDNAANYKAAGDILIRKRKRIYWTPCAAHCIDLILEDFDKKLTVHKLTIAKARRLITYIYSRTLLISMLRHFTKKRDLIRPASTRFATSYLTLSCLSEHKVSLMTMFSSKTWKSSRFAATNDGKKIQQMVSDSRFWANILTCLKAVCPLIKVLRLVDSDEKPVMGFIYEEMARAREKIKENFNGIKKNFEPVLKIVDERWELQLHKPLHATAYYLNPHYHYSPDFKVNAGIKIGLYNCLERMVPDPIERCKIDLQLESFKDAKGMFRIESAKLTRDKKAPAKWWDSYGDDCPELQKFAIRVLSLTCSSSGCERNWINFEMVHTKKKEIDYISKK